MANRVENKDNIGNPYHDEKTGQFTSAGVSAIKEQIESDSFTSNKEIRLDDVLSKYGNNLYSFLNNEKSNHLIRDFIDNYGSVPSFMNRYGNLLKYATKQNIKVNHNDGLDKIGLDLISYDGNLDDLTPENIFERMNFMDIKSTYRGKIMLMGAQLVGGEMKQDGLINPYKKMNNLFALQFFDGLDKLSDKAIAKKMIFQDMYSKEFKPNAAISSKAYLLNRKELYNTIYEYIPQEAMKQMYELANDGFKRGKTLPEIYNRVCTSNRQFREIISEPGYGVSVLEMGDITLMVKSDIRKVNNPIFEINVKINENFIKNHFPKSELTYANIKNNQLNA